MKAFNCFALPILVFNLVWLLPISAIFHDEAGKNDWHMEMLGRVTALCFPGSSPALPGKAPMIYVGSELGVVAYLDGDTGKVLHRRVYAEQDQIKQLKSVSSALIVHTASRGLPTGSNRILNKVSSHAKAELGDRDDKQTFSEAESLSVYDSEDGKLLWSTNDKMLDFLVFYEPLKRAVQTQQSSATIHEAMVILSSEAIQLRGLKNARIYWTINTRLDNISDEENTDSSTSSNRFSHHGEKRSSIDSASYYNSSESYSKLHPHITVRTAKKLDARDKSLPNGIIIERFIKLQKVLASDEVDSDKLFNVLFQYKLREDEASEAEESDSLLGIFQVNLISGDIVDLWLADFSSDLDENCSSDLIASDYLIGTLTTCGDVSKAGGSQEGKHVKEGGVSTRVKQYFYAMKMGKDGILKSRKLEISIENDGKRFTFMEYHNGSKMLNDIFVLVDISGSNTKIFHYGEKDLVEVLDWRGVWAVGEHLVKQQYAAKHVYSPAYSGKTFIAMNKAESSAFVVNKELAKVVTTIPNISMRDEDGFSDFFAVVALESTATGHKSSSSSWRLIASSSSGEISASMDDQLLWNREEGLSEVVYLQRCAFQKESKTGYMSDSLLSAIMKRNPVESVKLLINMAVSLPPRIHHFLYKTAISLKAFSVKHSLGGSVEKQSLKGLLESALNYLVRSRDSIKSAAVSPFLNKRLSVREKLSKIGFLEYFTEEMPISDVSGDHTEISSASSSSSSQNQIILEIDELSVDTSLHGWDSVFVAATRANQVYGIHASTGLILWKRVFGKKRLHDKGENIRSLHIVEKSLAKAHPFVLVSYVEDDSKGSKLAWINPMNGEDLSDGTNSVASMAFLPSHIIPCSSRSMHSVCVSAGIGLTESAGTDGSTKDTTGVDEHVVLVDEKKFFWVAGPKREGVFPLLAAQIPSSLLADSYLHEVSSTSDHFVRGYYLTTGKKGQITGKESWKLEFGKAQERIIAKATLSASAFGQNLPFRVLGNRSILYKYVNSNLIYIITEFNSGLERGNEEFDSIGSRYLSLYAIDGVTGSIVHSESLPEGASSPVYLLGCEHLIYVHYWNSLTFRYEMRSTELFDVKQDKGPLNLLLSPAAEEEVFSTFRQSYPLFSSRTYVFPTGISALGISSTSQGLTPRSLLMASASSQIYSVPIQTVNARNPVTKNKNLQTVYNITAQDKREGIAEYQPFTPLTPAMILSYTLRIHGANRIVSFPAKIESTSLVVAYGMDIFFSPVKPAMGFDSLESFDYTFLIGLMIAYAAATVTAVWYSEKSKMKKLLE